MPPEKYWLKPELFDFKKFDYDDIKCIYNSPRTLIEDFEKIEGFKCYALEIVKRKKRKIISKRDTKKNSKLIQATKNILINLSFFKS